MATTMAAQRGTKRFCISEPCGRAFYDLKKEPSDCPYCGEDYVAPPVVVPPNPADFGKKSYYKSYKHQEAPIKPVVEEAAEGDAEEIAVEAGDDGDDAIEKTDDILEIDEEVVAPDDIVDPSVGKDDNG